MGDTNTMAEVVLALIIGGLVIERYFFAKHMTEQLENCMKAVMSRNINDYLAATNQPKKDTEFTQNEDIDIDQASDEEFMKAVNKFNSEVS